jgi:predicted metal-dependent RNase
MQRRFVGDHSAVIIAPSGSLKGGMAVKYASRIAGKPKNAIYFPGFQFKGTPGRALLDAESGQRFTFHVWDNGSHNDVEVELLCEVEWFSSFSAHADQTGLVAFIKAFNANRTVLVHGEIDAIDTLTQKLSADGITCEIPKNGDEIIL